MENTQKRGGGMSSYHLHHCPECDEFGCELNICTQCIQIAIDRAEDDRQYAIDMAEAQDERAHQRDHMPVGGGM
jgi:hypothetical protein